MFSLTSKEKEFLEALNNYNIRFILVGLSSAIIQNAHVVTQDIDLWVEDISSPDFAEAVKSVGGFYIPPGTVGINPPMLGPDSLKIFDLVGHMHGLEDFSSEYNLSLHTTIEGLSLRILSLERIIKSKEVANREKDRAVLPALKATLLISKKLG